MYKGLKQFNDMPVEIKNEKNEFQFCRKLKLYVKKMCDDEDGFFFVILRTP